MTQLFLEHIFIPAAEPAGKGMLLSASTAAIHAASSCSEFVRSFEGVCLHRCRLWQGTRVLGSPDQTLLRGPEGVGANSWDLAQCAAQRRWRFGKASDQRGEGARSPGHTSGQRNRCGLFVAAARG